MTKKHTEAAVRHSDFVIPWTFDIRHSSFVIFGIRLSDKGGRYCAARESPRQVLAED
jgi:hypothetical protein